MKTFHLMVAAVVVSSVSGCACHSTDANEVGVLTRKLAPFGKRGVQEEVYASGATYFFAPIITDWHTFETKLQNLRMQKMPGADGVIDDVEFKTVDGNDISVDVTVTWRIDPAKAPHVLQRVGESTDDVQERLVRPAARAYVRDALNRLRSEDFYVADKRFAAAEESRKLLLLALGPEGVIVEQVILGEHRFAPAYEEVIREKKLAEQNGEKLKSEAQAAAEESKRNLESARGVVSKDIATAKGELEQAKLGADAQLVKAKNEATASLTEAKTRAQSIEKENAALGGAGGRTMVKLKIAEALQGKRIVMIPTGKGANLQTLDVNDLISVKAAQKVTK
ncbi:MAG: prohibitin family protein [Archangiaceae bacterium]|nr:prohibitin family protein [Archangiaceae bacterium]